MKVAIYGRTFSKEFTPYIELIFTLLKENQCEAVIFKPFSDFITQQMQVGALYETFTSHDEIQRGIDLFISIGGDGTFLEAVSFVRNSQVPMIGINSGRLGFLANIAKEDIQIALPVILEKKYTIENRTLLECQNDKGFFADFPFALNEVTFQKHGTTMITIDTWIDGEFVNTYWADGMIISTPTGSTAYSLSVGGPIMIPGANNFILAPIAPHNLNVRPLIISDSSQIMLKVGGRSGTYLVSVDSKSEIVNDEIEITLKKADFHIPVIKLPNNSFFATIRNKLHWGLDQRN
jgi:NAD+ kinase